MTCDLELVTWNCRALPFPLGLTLAPYGLPIDHIQQEGQPMVRRFISAAALVVCAAGYVFAAERATFILTNGERKSGEVVFHGGNAANFIDGQLNLGDNGKEQSFPIDQVAVINFAGGAPGSA